MDIEPEFPPLPSSDHSTKHSTSASPNKDNGYRGVGVAHNGAKTIHRILSRDGDAILEYVDTESRKSMTHYRWQVSSDSLMKNSPFFSALLDPNKFSEGRQFVEKKARSKEESLAMFDIKSNNGSENESTERLPLISLNLSRLTGKHRIESLELFLKVLLSAHDADLSTKLGTELVQQPIPVIAGLIEISDSFSSAEVVNESLSNANYRPSVKGIQSLDVFNASLLKLSEERLRQIIYIAMAMRHDTVFRVASHALILLGSIKWLDGGMGHTKSGNHRWSYFENGLEEELYYRRQCIMNTITDLQAHFLREYGALEGETERNKPQTKNNMLATAVSSNARSLQCRWGFDNSRACDSFHLGEMIRFFSMRSRTIFLGSTLIDPSYDDDYDEEQDEREQWNEMKGYNDSKTTFYDENTSRAANVVSADILTITASLRQIPDYQIDHNHTGCGIRRRLLPLLDCIDGFLGHRQAVIGLVDVMLWKSSNASSSRRNCNPDSWRSSSLSKAEEVDVRAAKVVGIRKIRPGSPFIDITNHSKSSAVDKPGIAVALNTTSFSSSLLPLSGLQKQREEARLFLTAMKRNWES